MKGQLSIPPELIPGDPRFGVGPSLVPREHLRALNETGIKFLGRGHRKEGVKNLVKSIQSGLAQYFDLPQDYRVILGNGGATLLFDAVGLGLVERRITHFVCGEFSQKWYQSSAAIPWIESDLVKKDFGEGITPTAAPESDTVATTLNETSTGVMVDKLPQVDEETLLCVDATSGAGQIPCDLSQVDLYFFSPQKIFASEGGLYLAILSPKAIERASIVEKQSRYIPPFMSWTKALESGQKHQTYTTPALVTLFFLNKQIEQMNSLGSEKVNSMARKKAQLIYTWAEEKDYLSCYIKEEKYRSLSVATVDVDPSINVDDILAFLNKKGYAYDINAYRKLGRNQFRIGLFHNIEYSDLEKLTKLLSYLIEQS